MKDWERIRAERDDLTDYVCHLTKYRYERPSEGATRGIFYRAPEVLKEIVMAGVLRPTFTPFRTRMGNTNPNVRGPEPAVCFTAQPLAQLLTSISVLSGTRYERYGVAFHLADLHTYGGRPVIYGDQSLLGRQLLRGEAGYEEGKEIYSGGLAPSDQYLWVRYNPVPNDGYPADFTHEREWRCKLQRGHRWGVPLLLHHPRWFESQNRPPFVILVARDKEIEDFRDFLGDVASWSGKPIFRDVPILSFETVAARLSEGDRRFQKIETALAANQRPSDAT